MKFSKPFKLLCSISAAGSVVYFISSETMESNLRKKYVLNFIGRNSVNAATASQDSSKFGEWNYNWDRRDPFNLINPEKLSDIDGEDPTLAKDKFKNRLSEYTPTATRHLLFIRHGQYKSNYKEDEMRSLTALGQEQAVYTGLRLRDLGFQYDRVVESSMTRAIETCSLVVDQLTDLPKVVRTDLLREGSPIEPEPPFRHWRSDVSTHTDGPRIESAFRKFVHRADISQKEDSVEIFVCHANVIRYIVCRALQLPPEAWLRMSLHHGSITWLTIRPSGYVSLKCLGEAGHMPCDKLST